MNITRHEAHAAAMGTAPLAAALATPPYNDRFQQRYGSALSPQAITAAQRMGDTGYLYQFIDILDELRESDPHLHAELFKREAMVAGAEWELRPPEDSGALGAEIAKTPGAALQVMRGQVLQARIKADAQAHLEARRFTEDVTDYFDKAEGYAALAAFIRDAHRALVRARDGGPGADEAREAIEDVLGVVRAGGGFRMELDCEKWQFFMSNAFHTLIV